MKMLRIWRPTCSSDAMSYIHCGCRTDDHTSRTPLQAAEWNYTLSAARRRTDRVSGRISFRFDRAANQQLNWSRRLAAHGSAWVERTYSPQARTDVNARRRHVANRSFDHLVGALSTCAQLAKSASNVASH